MVKISPALQRRLQQRSKELRSGQGLFIRDRDSFDKVAMRIVPRPDDEPGTVFYALYASELPEKERYTVSPRTYGYACPVMDYLDRIRQTGSKEERELAYQYVWASTEYWIPVVLRGDEGTVQSPKIRIYRASKSVYQTLVDYMLEFQTDITDADDGRDFLLRKDPDHKGKGVRRTAAMLPNPSPLAADEALASALADLAAGFDVRNRFDDLRMEVLSGIYEGLTGEEIPDEYLGPLEELLAKLKKEPRSSLVPGDDDPDETPYVDDDADGDADVKTEEDVEDDASDTDVEGEVPDIVIGTTRVRFETDDAKFEGTVIGQEEDGSYLVVEDDGDVNEPWTMGRSDMEIVAPKKAPKSRKKVKKKTPSGPRRPDPKAASAVRNRLRGKK